MAINLLENVMKIMKQFGVLVSTLLLLLVNVSLAADGKMPQIKKLL